MVRIKRIRKRKVCLLAAAGILTAAVLVLFAVTAAFSVYKHVNRASSAGSPEGAAMASEVRDMTAPQFTSQKEGPEILSENRAEEPVETGVSTNKTGVAIDDDSLQDVNSVVEGAPEEVQGEKRVYITFDDGPSVYTDEILDILKKYGVKATFFVCGTGDTDESLRHVYKRITDEGHTIGMHSYSHIYSRVYGDLDLFQYDLDKIRNLIYNETGVVPKYYRFPGGSGNTVASLSMDQYISVLYSQGMEYYDWNVYGGDSSGNSLSPQRIAEITLEGVDRRHTAVVLLHDTGSRKNTVLALPEIIEGLMERNLVIRPIDDDTPPLHQVDEAG